MFDADFLTKNNMTLINDANKRCMKEYQDYLLQKRKPRLYMLKNGSKDFFLKKIYARTNSYSSNELFSLEGWKCLKNGSTVSMECKLFSGSSWLSQSGKNDNTDILAYML